MRGLSFDIEAVAPTVAAERQVSDEADRLNAGQAPQVCEGGAIKLKHLGGAGITLPRQRCVCRQDIGGAKAWPATWCLLVAQGGDWIEAGGATGRDIVCEQRDSRQQSGDTEERRQVGRSHAE